MWALMPGNMSLMVPGLKQTNSVSGFSWTGLWVSISHLQEVENQQLKDKEAQNNIPNL